MTDSIDIAIAEVRAELERAMELYPAMNSCHEGHSVIAEELDEMWDIVKQKPGKRVLSDLRAEARQTAAMAIRFMLDVCSDERGRR